MTKAKVGDTINILGFKPDTNGKIYSSEAKLIGTTGVVERIDPNGILHGTWAESDFFRKINTRSYYSPSKYSRTWSSEKDK